MHRIIVDLQVAQSPDSGHRGMGRYAVEMTRALLRAGAPIEAIAVNPVIAHRALPDDLRESGLVVTNTAEHLDRARLGDGPIAYHVMSPMEEPTMVEVAMPRFLSRVDAQVMVVYDLIPFIFDDPYLRQVDRREQNIGRLRRVQTADLLLAISECTRRDFIEQLGIEEERIVTVGTGVSDRFRPPAPGDDPVQTVRLAWPQITRPFVMCVPAFEWRKNAETLIRAFARLPADVRAAHQLVIACAAPAVGIRTWRRLAADVGLREDELVITDFVPDELLVSLYQATRLNVFPSRYEGFGLPVAEASRCGAASLSSDRGSLPEVLDYPPSTFAADDADALADLMARALVDGPFRDGLLGAATRAATVHTWERVAQRTLDAYERLERPAPPLRRARRPRVAVVGPLPPVASGVAVYTERVLDAWSRDDYELDVYAEASPVGAWPPDVVAARVFPASALGATTNPGDYDAIVYAIGTSRVHIETFERARRFPGIVWLHDVNVVGLLLEFAERLVYEERLGWRGERRQRDVRDVMRDELVATYGSAYPADLFADSPAYDAAIERGPLFAASVVAGAKAVIVQSPTARALLLRDLEVAGGAPPAISVLPHAFAPVSSFERVSRDTTPLVVSFGFCAARKAPERIVDAVGRLAQRVQLVFAGSCTADSRRRIEERAAALGISDAVHITGYLDDDGYRAWLQRAWCAVQLRTVDFGESTGTVHDAMAAGVPVITNVASARDLPKGTVINIDLDVDELARRLEVVLFDGHTAAELTRRAQAHAASWTYADVAHGLRAVIDDVIPVSSKPFILAR
ncbi:MAG: glycosyltransferase [Acidimicrobiales bacterium]